MIIVWIDFVWYKLNCKGKCKVCLKFTKIIADKDKTVKGAGLGNPKYLYEKVQVNKNLTQQDFFDAVLKHFNETL